MEVGTVFIGTVICTVPMYGVALVTTDRGAVNLKNLIVAHLPISDSTTGAMPQQLITDGSAVVCLRHLNSPEKAYIIGPANHASCDLYDSLKGRALYNVHQVTEQDDPTFTNAILQLLSRRTNLVSNQANGVDMDAIPGDYDVTDMTGNVGLHIGRFLVQLHGSPLAFIDVSNIENAIRSVAQRIEEHTLVGLHTKGEGLEVGLIAVSLPEAFGMKEGPVMKEKDGKLELTHNTLPLYRIQHLEGAVADGTEDKIISFPIDETLHHGGTEPPILSIKKSTLLGEQLSAGAHGCISIKTPFIRGAQVFGYGMALEDDVLTPFKYVPKEEDEQPEELTPESVSDAAINKLIDKLFTGPYLERLKERMAQHGLMLSSEGKTLGDQAFKEVEGSQTAGATDQQEYGLPPYLNVTDPVTGRTVLYFKSTSFISQEPDGSILLADGYGSEIRMSRGNIYISPALDLFMRPGRDMSGMIPRHLSLNAQRYITINSSKSVYIKAEGDLKMLGGNGGEGMVTLENRATTPNSTANGLLLKSRSNTVMVGANLYIGRNKGNGKNKNRVDEPSDNGMIIIDACRNGIISERSAVHTVDSGEFTAIASKDNKASAFIVTPQNIGVYSEVVDMPATLSLVGKKSQDSVTVYRNGQPETINLSASTRPYLAVEGSCHMGGGITCEQVSVFKAGAAINGVFANSMFCSVIDRRGDDPFAKQPLHKSAVAGGIGKSAADALKQLSNLLYQDWFVSTNEFLFPENYGVPTLRVPGMLWQTQSLEAGKTGAMWEETFVTSYDDKKITGCYPGKDIWDSAKISQRGNKTADLKSDYVTNTPREESNNA